jgi:hypothetical protein
MQYMRRMVSVGLLLLALQCHTLLEDAGTVRKVDSMTAVKQYMVLDAEAAEEVEAVAAGALPAPVHVSSERFKALNVGFFVGLLVQGLWLVKGAILGNSVGPVDLVNLDGALWAPLYWGVLAGMVYGWTVLLTVDFGSIARGTEKVFSWASGVVYAVAAVMFVDWIWINEGYRE